MTEAPAIATEELTRRFGETTVVRDLELCVPRGCVYGFLGPNGAGKTTTIRMLLGLIRPDKGRSLLFGKSLEEERATLLRRVGALVEGPSLYPQLTGRENLEVRRRLLGARRANLADALALVDLEDAADRPVEHYSLGMRQRLGLALAFLTTPELLILDEPANGLDPAGIREMRDLLRRLPEERGTTVFVSSHLLAEIEQVATQVGIINGGELVFQGDPAELRAQVKGRARICVDRTEDAQRSLAQQGWTVKADELGGLIAEVEGEQDARAINDLLVHAGIGVHHLALHTPTLEDVFLELTAKPTAGEESS